MMFRKALLTLCLSLAAFAALAVERVDSFMVRHTNAVTVLAPSTTTLESYLSWFDTHWHTQAGYASTGEVANATNSLRAEIGAATNVLATNATAQLATKLTGTNFTDALYNSTNQTWRIDWTNSPGAPEVLDYMVITGTPTWYITNSATAVSAVYSSWNLSYTTGLGYLSFSNNSTLYVPSNTVAVMWTEYTIRTKTTTDVDVVTAITRGTAGTTVAAQLGTFSQEGDTANPAKAFYPSSASVNVRPYAAERRYQTRATLLGSNSTSNGIAINWKQWKILLFRLAETE
jgi:hypothetical protein